MTRAVALLAALLLAAVPGALARPGHHPRCTRATKKHHRRCSRPRHHHAPAGRQPITPTPTSTTPSAAPAPAGGGADPAPQTPEPPATTSPAARLGVVTREYSLTLSRTTVPEGTAVVQLQNFGEDPHNLRIQRVDGSGTPTDFAQAGPGGLESESVTLSPGVYKLYCTLPGHDALGMHATLTVGGQ